VVLKLWGLPKLPPTEARHFGKFGKPHKFNTTPAGCPVADCPGNRHQRSLATFQAAGLFAEAQG